MKHLQDSHIIGLTSYWQGSVGSIYYPLQALGFLTVTSMVHWHMPDNINIPFTWQSQKAFRLANWWMVEGILYISVLLWNLLLIYLDILD